MTKQTLPNTQKKSSAPATPLDVYLFPGGPQSNPYMRLLGNALKKISPDITILPDAINKLDMRCLKRDGKQNTIIHMHWVPEIYPRLIRGRILYYILSTFVYIKIFLQILLIAAMKFIRNAKVIWTVHNANAYHLRPAITPLLTAWFSGLADAYIFHCKEARDDFFSNSSRHAQKPCFIIPHGNLAGIYGPMEENQNEARIKLNLPADNVIFLIAGTMRRAKQLKWLFSELSALPQQNSRFLIAGDPLTASDQKLCEEYQSDRRFIFVPRFIPNAKMPTLFAAADFFISAQQRGYISGIAVAALSYGLPVIQLNWGCASSIIQHGKNGFLFEKENFQKVAAQAISIRIGADSYQKMRSMALDSAKCLDLAGIAAKTIDAYLQVLAQNERSPFS